MSQRAKTSLINFLLEVVPSALDCSRQQLTTLLTGKGEEQLKRFLRETDVHCLIVGKEKVIDSGVGDRQTQSALQLQQQASREEGKLEYSEAEIQHQVFIETYMTSRCLKASLMVFVKNPGFQVSEDGIISTSADRGGASGTAEGAVDSGEAGGEGGSEEHTKGSISHSKSLASSLQCIQLGFSGSQLTPYEVLNQYLQFAFTPLLDALGNVRTASTGVLGDSDSGEAGESGSHLGLENIQRKVNELCLALQQGQDDSMIPMVRLTLDPRVSEYSKDFKSTGKIANFEEISEDSAFLASLQGSITQWIREIQSLARFQRDLGLSVTSEVKFWSSYERSLQLILKQVQSPEVEWTLAVLRQSKKFLAAISVEVDTGLKQSLERVQNINTLIQDIPISDLLVASSVDEITSAVGLFFQHLRKIKGAASYPISRAFQLVEVYSADMTKQVYKVLQNNPVSSLMLLEFPVFEHLVNGCNELGQVWEDEWRELKELIRDLIKKRGLSERAHPKMDFAHVPLIQRLNDIVVFRKQHQKLKDTLLELLSVQDSGSENRSGQNALSALGIEQNSGLDALQSLAKKDLQQAYACVSNINILDLSANGLEAWEAGKLAYNNKVDASETLLIKQLREQLGSCGNTLEMFRILGVPEHLAGKGAGGLPAPAVAVPKPLSEERGLPVLLHEGRAERRRDACLVAPAPGEDPEHLLQAGGHLRAQLGVREPGPQGQDRRRPHHLQDPPQPDRGLLAPAEEGRQVHLRPEQARFGPDGQRKRLRFRAGPEDHPVLLLQSPVQHSRSTASSRRGPLSAGLPTGLRASSGGSATPWTLWSRSSRR
ncbi:dynein heavy chain [Cryptosporidium felis]|nr:dynein heavy chain [Cryptosporidium felis]